MLPSLWWRLWKAAWLHSNRPLSRLMLSSVSVFIILCFSSLWHCWIKCAILNKLHLQVKWSVCNRPLTWKQEEKKTTTLSTSHPSPTPSWEGSRSTTVNPIGFNCSQVQSTAVRFLEGDGKHIDGVTTHLLQSLPLCIMGEIPSLPRGWESIAELEEG